MKLHILDFKKKYKDFWYIWFENGTPANIHDIVEHDYSLGYDEQWVETMAISNQEDLNLLMLVYDTNDATIGKDIMYIEGHVVHDFHFDRETGIIL